MFKLYKVGFVNKVTLRVEAVAGMYPNLVLSKKGYMIVKDDGDFHLASSDLEDLARSFYEHVTSDSKQKQDDTKAFSFGEAGFLFVRFGRDTLTYKACRLGIRERRRFKSLIERLAVKE